MTSRKTRTWGKSILLFFLWFLLLYGGMQGLIGMTVPGGRFQANAIAGFLDIPSGLRYSLLKGAQILLDLLNMDSYISNGHHLRLVDGRGVRMVYSCMGYGIMSFWAAFALAFSPTLTKAFKWLLFGWIYIWSVNVIRIAGLVIATNKNWPMPFQIDHHAWFNLAVYLGIGGLIYLFDRSIRRTAEYSN